MHVGHSYQTTYLIEDYGSSRILQRTEEEKDFGVYVDPGAAEFEYTEFVELSLSLSWSILNM